MVTAWLVAEFGDQLYPLEELEVSTTFAPWQNVVGPPAVIVGTAGVGLTVTANVVAMDAPQPLLAVTCTFPLTPETVVVIAVVEDVPVQPDGIVQVQDVAPVTGEIEYVFTEL